MRDLDVLLQEHRTFPPPAAFRERARVADPALLARAAEDPEGFWAGEAATLQWDAPWDTVLRWTPPHARWFEGGRLNAAVNCVDRHLDGPRRNKAALIWEGEPGDRRTLTYWDLYREVNVAASMLRHLGVRRGDRVAIYLPLIPEAVIAMLACARIGAVHTVVFGGFSPESLRDRITDCGCTVLITADGGYRRGAVVPLKRNADAALAECPTVKHVLVVRRAGSAHTDETHAQMVEGRDHWWHQLATQVPAECPPESMAAEDLLSSSTPRGPRGSPRGSCTPPAATSPAPPPPRGGCSTCATTTCTGAPPTSGGSPGTATWCTARWPTAPPACCTRGPPTGPPPTASGSCAHATA